MKKIIFPVTNDLNQDQRMNRICGTLAKNGYEPVLLGRMRERSEPLLDRPFEQLRMPCFFQRGKAFYAEYNIRLFFHLLFNKYDMYCAIDLDTMLPTVAIAKWKRKPVVYDAHEYFTELEEVVKRPKVRKFWKWVERWGVPKCDAAYTVSDGYKRLFEEEYSVDFKIVRNATVLQSKSTKEDGGYILYQGAVNEGRGLRETVLAMKSVDFQLVICGVGDIYEELVELVREEGLEDKVVMKGFVASADLVKITERATIGLTIFSNAGLSNEHSLANRYFDYLHNGVPQICMDYPEYAHLNQLNEVGVLLSEVSVTSIADTLNELLSDKQKLQRLHENTKAARKVLNWGEEEKVLVGVYDGLSRSLD